LVERSYLSSYPSAWLSGFPYFVHAAGEKHLASLNIDWTVLRPTRFMPFTPFVWSSVVREGLLFEQAGNGLMTTIAQADVAAVGLFALTANGHEGKAYNLTSEDAFSTRELGRILSNSLKKPITVFHGGVEELRLALMENGVPSEYAPTMSHYFETVEQGRWKVTDRVAQVLGRKPEDTRIGSSTTCLASLLAWPDRSRVWSPSNYAVSHINNLRICDCAYRICASPGRRARCGRRA
jgi:nucleoside-diphosphate-sugar epimerase